MISIRSPFPDALPESKTSGNEKILEGNNGTDESFDSDLTKLLEEPEVLPSISNVSASNLVNLDKVLTEFVKMPGKSLPSDEKNEGNVVREHPQGASSSERGCTIKRERSVSSDSASTKFLAGLSGSSSDRDSNARSASISDHIGDSNIQSSSDATSIDCLTINQEMCDSINSSSDSWVDETDVLAAMQNLSLSSSRVVVSSKDFAGVMLKARPPAQL